jgi:hypothetical protein
MMPRRSRATIAACLALSACGGGVIQTLDAPPPPPPGLATLQIVAEPPDVEVTIDDAFAGQLSGYRDGLIAVRPGPHRVRLGRSGCHTGYYEVDVPPAGGRLRTHLVCTTPN